MANGGKDIKFGHDKRPVTRIEATEQNLFNIANGELLTDEFGIPLITEVDTFFLKDATAERSTSVVFPKDKSSAYRRGESTTVGIHTARYSLTGRLVSNSVPFTVRKVNGSVVTAGNTINRKDGTTADFSSVSVVNILKANGAIGSSNLITFAKNVGISTIVKVQVGDFVSGAEIPAGTMVSAVEKNFIFMNNDSVGTANTSGTVQFIRYTNKVKTANQACRHSGGGKNAIVQYFVLAPNSSSRRSFWGA